MGSVPVIRTMGSDPIIIDGCGVEPEQLVTPRFKYGTFSGMMKGIRLRLDNIKECVQVEYF
jgi:hypothetical protein